MAGNSIVFRDNQQWCLFPAGLGSLPRTGLAVWSVGSEFCGLSPPLRKPLSNSFEKGSRDAHLYTRSLKFRVRLMRLMSSR